MIPGGGAILFAGPGDWRIAQWSGEVVSWSDAGFSSQSDPADIAEKLPAALDRAGCRGGPIVFALASADCLAATIPTNALPRRDRRRAMEYRLEGKIPLAIEDVRADFVTHNGRSLGVCVQTEKITAAMDVLRRCRMTI